YRGILARARQREQGGAIRGAFLRLERDHPLAENAREQLAPKGTLRAPARRAHRIHAYAETLDDVEAIALAIGDAFDDGADEVGACVAVGQADPAAAGSGVEVRGALAHQVWQPEESLRAGGRL